MSAAPARQAQPSPGSLVRIASGLLLASYVGRERTAHLSHGLQLHLVRLESGLLKLTARRPGGLPSETEIAVLREAFGAGDGATVSPLNTGFIVRWSDDVCSRCGIDCSPHGQSWGSLENHVLCARCYPPAAAAWLASRRRGPVVEQHALEL